MAPLPADAPVLRWQSGQWHRLTMRGSPDMFARSDPQWHWASLFICNHLCIDVHDGSARFRHAFSDVLGMSGSRPSSAEKSSQERAFRLPAAQNSRILPTNFGAEFSMG